MLTCRCCVHHRFSVLKFGGGELRDPGRARAETVRKGSSVTRVGQYQGLGFLSGQSHCRVMRLPEHSYVVMIVIRALCCLIHLKLGEKIPH